MMVNQNLNEQYERRGGMDKLRRGICILRRYGIRAGTMRKKLALYTSLLDKYGCICTFPVTASLVYKYSDILKKLISRKIEIAIHGYTHIDLTELSQEEQSEEIEKAIQEFRDLRLPLSGFRSPYLRWNLDTVQAIGKSGLSYSSNRTFLWDIPEIENVNRNRLASYRKVIEFYGAQHVDEYLSLPRFLAGVLDIPVSLPDDEMLVERLRFADASQIGQIWNSILEMSYRYGELFTLQLHPERIEICRQALHDILKRAISMKPKVWIANLSEIAEWWRLKDMFTIKAEKLNSPFSYVIEVNCSENAALLARNVDIQCDTRDWLYGYQLVDRRRFQLTSPIRPFVGVSSLCPRQYMSFLKSNGYAVEISDKKHDYGIYIDENVKSLSERRLATMIENSNAPVLRFWRWPDGARSALCITGDIDWITLLDFLPRIWK